MGEDITECRECQELLDLLVDYLDGNETAEMRRELMEHVTSCGQCARLLYSLRRVVGTCRCEASAEVPVHVHRQLWQVLVEEFRVERRVSED